MAYGSEFAYGDGATHVGATENPDALPDLVGDLLNRAVAERIRRNLTPGYVKKNKRLRRLRGNIDFLSTEANQLLRRGLIQCSYSEITANTVRNQFVRSSLQSLSNIVSDQNVARKAGELATAMGQMGVKSTKPSLAEIGRDRYGRHDSHDKPMVELAKLAHYMLLPAEVKGSLPTPDPSKDEVWVRKLYEKAIAGFYRHTLRTGTYQVRTGTQLKWPIETVSDSLHGIFPSMRTDIVIDDINCNKRLVIDTKFNSLITKGWLKDSTLRSQYIYQIYAYLRTQEDSGDPRDRQASGLLLHPTVADDFLGSIEIQGHSITFATVNLVRGVSEIKAQLKDIFLYSIRGSKPTM